MKYQVPAWNNDKCCYGDLLDRWFWADPNFGYGLEVWHGPYATCNAAETAFAEKHPDQAGTRVCGYNNSEINWKMPDDYAAQQGEGAIAAFAALFCDPDDVVIWTSSNFVWLTDSNAARIGMNLTKQRDDAYDDIQRLTEQLKRAQQRHDCADNMLTYLDNIYPGVV